MVIKNKRVKKKFSQCTFFPKNCNGWVKVLEVFVAIILVMGLIFFILDRGSPDENMSDDIYEIEVSILKSIQLNESFRTIILNSDVPSNWSNFDSGELNEIKQMILEKKLEVLDCEAKICSLREVCVLETEMDKEVYAQAVVISTDLNNYSPRQVKLFCWEK